MKFSLIALAFCAAVCSTITVHAMNDVYAKSPYHEHTFINKSERTIRVHARYTIYKTETLHFVSESVGRPFGAHSYNTGKACGDYEFVLTKGASKSIPPRGGECGLSYIQVKEEGKNNKDWDKERIFKEGFRYGTEMTSYEIIIHNDLSIETSDDQRRLTGE